MYAIHLRFNFLTTQLKVNASIILTNKCVTH